MNGVSVSIQDRKRLRDNDNFNFDRDPHYNHRDSHYNDRDPHYNKSLEGEEKGIEMTESVGREREGANGLVSFESKKRVRDNDYFNGREREGEVKEGDKKLRLLKLTDEQRSIPIIVQMNMKKNAQINVRNGLTYEQKNVLPYVQTYVQRNGQEGEREGLLPLFVKDTLTSSIDYLGIFFSGISNLNPSSSYPNSNPDSNPKPDRSSRNPDSNPISDPPKPSFSLLSSLKDLIFEDPN
jgi:hypothetical protein